MLHEFMNSALVLIMLRSECSFVDHKNKEWLSKHKMFVQLLSYNCGASLLLTSNAVCFALALSAGKLCFAFSIYRYYKS